MGIPAANEGLKSARVVLRGTGCATTASQADIGSLTVNFGQKRLKLLIQGSPIAGECSASSFRGQRLQTIENLRDVVQSAVDDLQGGAGIAGVQDALL